MANEMTGLGQNGLLYFWQKLKDYFVAKETGKGLSSNDYTSAEKTKLGAFETADKYATKTDISNLGNTYVAKEAGKGLSSNDFTAAEKAKLSAFSTADKYALKADISSVYRYKGSVATYDALPTTDLTAGDIYNVENDDMNYAWTGTAWDPLGASFSFRELTNEEIDAILTT